MERVLVGKGSGVDAESEDRSPSDAPEILRKSAAAFLQQLWARVREHDERPDARHQHWT